MDGFTCRELLHLEGWWWRETRNKHEALLNSFRDDLNMGQWTGFQEKSSDKGTQRRVVLNYPQYNGYIVDTYYLPYRFLLCS